MAYYYPKDAVTAINDMIAEEGFAFTRIMRNGMIYFHNHCNTRLVLTWAPKYNPDGAWFIACYPCDDEYEDTRQIVAALRDRGVNPLPG